MASTWGESYMEETFAGTVLGITSETELGRLYRRGTYKFL